MWNRFSSGMKRVRALHLLRVKPMLRLLKEAVISMSALCMLFIRSLGE